MKKEYKDYKITANKNHGTYLIVLDITVFVCILKKNNVKMLI